MGELTCRIRTDVLRRSDNVEWRSRATRLRSYALGAARGTALLLCITATVVGCVARNTHVSNQLAVSGAWRPLLHYLDGTPPTVYGNSVAFGGGPSRFSRRSQIYMGNLLDFHPAPVVTAGELHAYWNDIQLSQRWLVWIQVDLRGYWSIWAMRRSDRKRFVVDRAGQSQAAAYGLLLPHLWLDRDTIAWTRITCRRDCVTHWTAELELMRLPDGRKRPIVSTRYPCAPTSPSLSPRLLVWDREGICAGAPGYDIMAYDRRSGRIWQVTHDHMDSEPTTNGRYIAWKGSSDRLADGSIVVLDTSTGRRWTADRSGAATPSFTGSVLVWSGDDGGSVEALDLRPRLRVQLAAEVDTPRRVTVIGFVGRGSGGRIGWQETSIATGVGPYFDYVAAEDVPL